MLDTIYSFLIDIKYNINYGNKKSTRYHFIKEVYSRYHWGDTIDNNQLPGFTGSGLHGCAQGSTRSYAMIIVCIILFIFFAIVIYW